VEERCLTRAAAPFSPGDSMTLSLGLTFWNAGVMSEWLAAQPKYRVVGRKYRSAVRAYQCRTTGTDEPRPSCRARCRRMGEGLAMALLIEMHPAECRQCVIPTHIQFVLPDTT
jgi:hypothetical protein